jgi:hypothetical protein
MPTVVTPLVYWLLAARNSSNSSSPLCSLLEMFSAEDKKEKKYLLAHHADCGHSLSVLALGCLTKQF